MSKNESNEETRAIDVTGIVALVESARTAWSEYVEAGKGSVAEQCAVATFAARDLIGEGLTYPNVDAFRALFPNRDGDGSVSKSTITLWGRLGLIHSLGITPESDREVWTRVQSKGNSDKRIRDAIADPKATAAKVRKAVNGCYKKGQYVPVPKPDATPAEGGQHGNTAPVSTETELPVSMSGVLDLLETIAARVHSEPITPAEYKRLASVVETLSEVKSTPAAEVEAARKAA